MALEQVERFKLPLSPLLYSLFTRHWNEDMPYLRIASSGSEFCNSCKTLQVTMKSLPRTDVRVIAARDFLSRLLGEARMEFRVYKETMSKEAEENINVFCHFVCDFSEKVLLPKIQKQPGKLHLVTLLKFDILGVASGNDGLTDVYCLVEGHWTQEKTANAFFINASPFNYCPSICS